MHDHLDELLRDPARAMVLPLAETARLLATVEGLACVLRARLAAPTPAAEQPSRTGPHSNGDRLLTAADLSARLGLTIAQVYRRAGGWLFTRRLGRRTLRFSEQGLERYMRSAPTHAPANSAGDESPRAGQ
jgi:hypothetical protein